jgi:ATP-dependent Clp protease ATP-binding subunit ClpC
MARKRNPEQDPNQPPKRKIDLMRLVEKTSNPTAKKQAEIEKMVFGQSDAAKAVAQSLVRFEAGMRDPRRPIGVFLFIGPTGVGKTEMSRAIANMWFDNPDSDKVFLKLDMSEYHEGHTAARLVGSPPGYVGFGETPAIPHAWANRQDRKILLLDEIEKAHPDVLKIFLSAFEDGSYQARNGSKGYEAVHFENTLIIMTSNAGSREMHDAANHRAIGFPGIFGDKKKKSDVDVQAAAQKSLTKYFRPEFLRRVTPIVFNNLEVEQYGPILNKFLEQKNAESLAHNAPVIQLSREVREYLIAKALKDKAEGGSALRKVFEDIIVAEVSNLFLADDINYDEIVRFELQDGQLVTYAKPNPNVKTYELDDAMDFDPLDALDDSDGYFQKHGDTYRFPPSGKSVRDLLNHKNLLPPGKKPKR